VSSGQGMMGGGGFDPVCGFVERIAESVASFVFFRWIVGSGVCRSFRYTWRVGGAL